MSRPGLGRQKTLRSKSPSSWHYGETSVSCVWYGTLLGGNIFPPDDVKMWLDKKKLGRYSQFFKREMVDGKMLLLPISLLVRNKNNFSTDFTSRQVEGTFDVCKRTLKEDLQVAKKDIGEDY